MTADITSETGNGALPKASAITSESAQSPAEGDARPLAEALECAMHALRLRGDTGSHTMRFCEERLAAYRANPHPKGLTSVCHIECDGCLDAGKCAFPGKPAEPVRYPHPDEDDAVTLWAEIHRLRAAVQGPDGYATWQEAATAERVRRVAAEKALAAAQAPAPAHLKADAWANVPEGDPWDEHQLDGIFDAIRNDCGPATASRVRAILRAYQSATQAPAVTHGSDMLEPLIYAAMMHNGKPKTVAEFERVAANVADMLQRRAADAHEKPVASIYISADGSREFDDWRVDLPPGNHQLFTAPRPDQPQPESLPHPGAPEAEEMIDKLLAEYNRPANMKNAARAGYMAARRLLQNARQPLPAVEDAEPIGWGGVIETCAELCDPHFIAQQDLDELKRYAGNWNSTYRFFPIYAPGAQLTEGPAVLAERDALKAAIVELNAAEFAYARYIRSDGLEKHRQNRERRIAAWQAARKLVGADGSNVPVQPLGGE